MFMPDHRMIWMLATRDGFAKLRRAGEVLLWRFAQRAKRQLAGETRHPGAPR
jgi:hypothetical protein